MATSCSSSSSTYNQIKDPTQPGLDDLPTALIATIMTKLDVPSIQSLASTCKTIHSCATHIRSFLPNFHLPDIALPKDVLKQLLPVDNLHLRSLKLDCGRLDDSSLDFLIRPSLEELSLRFCSDFSWKLLSRVGLHCKNLRFLYLSSASCNSGLQIDVPYLEDLLTGCTRLETLILRFAVGVYLHRNSDRVALALSKLTSLEIGYIYSAEFTGLLSHVLGPHPSSSHPHPPIFPNLQKLCLSVDYITDGMISIISTHVISLTHLDLRDSPIMQPSVMSDDLTNAGLQQINAHGKLKHLSLVRSQENASAYFKCVNDLGILLMADKCSVMESISLGGFCQVTDTGYKTILHSCSKLYKLRVFHGTHLTDLMFHDIFATSLSLTHVNLRWCNLLTNLAVSNLAFNSGLSFLDLRDCRNLRDEALRAINRLPKLKTLLIDGCDISDVGLSYLSKGLMNSLVSLSVRGCKRLTDRCISSLFDGNSNLEIRELDLSNIPNLTDAAVLNLAKTRIPISELRMRQCPFIGDTSVVALASMQIDENTWRGSSLKLLDLYSCGGITQLAFRWLKKPYFPRMRWLGVTGTGSMNKDLVIDLAKGRPHLRIAVHGEELATDHWDDLKHDYYRGYEYEEGDEWLLRGEVVSDEETEDAFDMA